MTRRKFIARVNLNDLRDCSEMYIRNVIEHIAEEIVSHTPVASGQTRANWQLSFDSLGEGMCSCDKDPVGDITVAKMTEALRAFTLGDRVYISNSVPHIIMLENGYSKQAPGGILAVVLRETEQLLNGGIL